MTGLPDSATKNTGPPGNCGLQIHQTGFLGIFVLSLSDINMPHYSWYICNSKLTGNPVFHLANCTRVIKKKLKKKTTRFSLLEPTFQYRISRVKAKHFELFLILKNVFSYTSHPDSPILNLCHLTYGNHLRTTCRHHVPSPLKTSVCIS